MPRLIGKDKSDLKSTGSVTAGNLSKADLLTLFQDLRTKGSITGVWSMNELYNSVVESTWIDDLNPSTARATSGGTMTLNSVSLGSYDYTYINTAESISSFSNGNYFTTTEDSRSALIYVDGDLTIASGQTFIPSNRKLFTAIFVNGNLDVDGTISMSLRGANHGSSPGSSVTKGAVKLIANGTYSSVPNPIISEDGAGGGAVTATAQSNDDKAGNVGSNGSGGGTGGGGGGGAGVGGNNPGGYNGQAKGGAGATGTSFSGGPGGGGAVDLTGGSLDSTQTGASGSANGGQGGKGSPNPSHYSAEGGAGNPGGQGTDADGDQPVTNGKDGTGGCLVIFVEGNYTGDGDIEAKGRNNNGEGGSSGGGHVSIFVKGTDNGPTPSAAGGVTDNNEVIDSAIGGNGGAGTARKMAYS